MLNIQSRTRLEETDAVTFAAIRGTQGPDNLEGTSEDDNIQGFDGADTLSGLGGRDILRGGQGDDILKGGNDRDALFGGKDTDDLLGGGGDDQLRSGGGEDKLRGGGGDDFLSGGGGEDRLVGGAGADTFRIAGDGACDKVTDFNALEGDLINGVGFSLLNIEVDIGASITSTAFFDGNGDGIADACIQVNGILDPISIIL